MGLEQDIQAKFAHLSDERLMARMNSAEDFGYDDEEVELTRRLKLGGLAWRWADINGKDRVEVYKPLTDADHINDAILEARKHTRLIDDATARVIASQIHGGQASPLYALSSSGAIEPGLLEEIDWAARDDKLDPLARSWAEKLEQYVMVRIQNDRCSAVEGWNELWLGGDK